MKGNQDSKTRQYSTISRGVYNINKRPTRINGIGRQEKRSLKEKEREITKRKLLFYHHNSQSTWSIHCVKFFENKTRHNSSFISWATTECIVTFVFIDFNGCSNTSVYSTNHFDLNSWAKICLSCFVYDCPHLWAETRSFGRSLRLTL